MTADPVRDGGEPASPPPMDAVATLTAAADLQGTALAILEREEASIRRVIGRYVHNPHAVDDLYQEVCLKAIRRLGSVREPDAVRGWIYQLARNASIDFLRRRAAAPDRDHEAVAEELPAHGEHAREPGDQVLSRERIDAIHRALADLPASQREAIRLRIEDGLDHEGIAARLGISRQAVEVRLCRGRAALKSMLDRILGGDL